MFPDGSDQDVEVFYLASEGFRGGHRWIIKRYGRPEPVLTGSESFATEAAARLAGKPSLIAVSARARGRRTARRRDE